MDMTLIAMDMTVIHMIRMDIIMVAMDSTQITINKSLITMEIILLKSHQRSEETQYPDCYITVFYTGLIYPGAPLPQC